MLDILVQPLVLDVAAPAKGSPSKTRSLLGFHRETAYSTCNTHHSMLLQSHTDSCPGRPSRNQNHSNHQYHPVALKCVVATSSRCIVLALLAVPHGGAAKTALQYKLLGCRLSQIQLSHNHLRRFGYYLVYEDHIKTQTPTRH